MSENLPVKADQKTEALGRTIEYGESGMVIRTVDDLKNLAKWAVESGFLPEQIRTAQQAFVIMVSGAELGLRPMAAVKFLYLTKARRVALMTKGALAVVQSKPSFDGYKEWTEGEGREMRACAWAKRKGMEGITKEFSYQDAEVAGLLKERKNREGQTYDSTYQAYLKDMLLSRARGRVLDIVFAAELGGIPIEGIAEDADRMAAQEPREVQAQAPPRRDPLLAQVGQKAIPVEAVVMTPADAAGPELDPSLVKIISDQVDEMWPKDTIALVNPDGTVAGTIVNVGSGPPPAAKPKPTKPAHSAPLGKTTAGPGEGGGATVRVVENPDVKCPRCGHLKNAMGGCDVCGYPGKDMR